MAEVTELVTNFSFTGSVQPLNKYNQALGKGIGLLAGMVAALGASGLAVSRWASQINAGTAELQNLANTSGESVAFIQEMEYAFTQMGGEAQAFRSTISGLSQTIGDAAQNGSEQFSRLGINVRDASGELKSAEQIIYDLRESFDTLDLDVREQQTFLSSLGIDPNMVQLLNASSGEIASLRAEARELFQLNEEQTEAAWQQTNAMNMLRYAHQGLKQTIAVGLGPQLEAMAEWMTEALKANRDWIIDGIQYSMEFIGEFMSMLGRLTPIIIGLTTAFVGLKVATLGLSGALAVLLSPALLIAAGIAAVILVVDDLIVAFRGGQSVIADFFEEFFGIDIVPILKAIVAETVEAIGMIQDFFRDMIGGFSDIFLGIQNIMTGNFDEAWANIKEGAFALVEAITRPFRSFFEWIKSQFDWVGGIVNTVTGWASWGGDDADISSRPSDFEPGGRQGAVDSPISYQVSVEQNINSSNPDRAGQVASEGIQRQLRDAQTQQRGRR